mmetsp:Transcript_29371/g.80262  ORF Transcript_29371/g.80262 Transcript_29371/m.80262 type:complete len:246 (-) Transcript_29371:146-883(-)
MAEDTHYAAVSDVYETAWCYQNDGDFQKWLLARVQESLPTTCSALVDIGCGTANFSGALQKQSGIRVTGVEPSAKMAAKASEHGVHVEIQDAQSWAESGGEDVFDAMLLKEVRHHFDAPERLYPMLANRLAPGGRILLLTRPDESSGYPFPAKAHQSWQSGVKVPLTTHIEALEVAGLTVQINENRYPVSIERAEWERLIRARFWSNLTSLSDNEIEDGLEELALPDVINYDDRMVFVIAQRTAN